MKNILSVLCSVIMMMSCQSNVNGVMPELDLKSQLLGLESVQNARQLGGYCIGKKQIKENLLIRTAKLSDMSAADSTLLSDKYKLQCIYDFRGKDEVATDPDVIPGNARHISLSISFSGQESQSSVKYDNMGDIIKMLLEYAEHPSIQNMCISMYDLIFFEESSQEVYRKFFADLVTADPNDGAVLWHCTQGKDRAGCASAMLLAALGADRNLIMADYNLSKEYYEPLVSQIPVQTEAQKTVINTLIGANPVIFEAALDKIDARYGSFANYLNECIGVTPQMMQVLRERYLN